MSFFVWWPKGAVTAACDEDVARLCLIGHPTLHQMPGAVGACLARAVSRRGAALLAPAEVKGRGGLALSRRLPRPLLSLSLFKPKRNQLRSLVPFRDPTCGALFRIP
jgi:hypothetical protein